MRAIGAINSEKHSRRTRFDTIIVINPSSVRSFVGLFIDTRVRAPAVVSALLSSRRKTRAARFAGIFGDFREIRETRGDSETLGNAGNGKPAGYYLSV